MGIQYLFKWSADKIASGFLFSSCRDKQKILCMLICQFAKRSILFPLFTTSNVLWVGLRLKNAHRFNVHSWKCDKIFVPETVPRLFMAAKISKATRPQIRTKDERILWHPSYLFSENVQWMTHALRRRRKKSRNGQIVMETSRQGEDIFLQSLDSEKYLNLAPRSQKMWKKNSDRSCAIAPINGHNIETPTSHNWYWVVEGHRKRSRSPWRAVKLSLFANKGLDALHDCRMGS